MSSRLQLPLLLLALAIAVALKVSVHESEQLTEKTLPDLPINYVPTEADLVIIESVDVLQVRLRGKASDMEAVNALTVYAQVDVPPPAGPDRLVEINLDADDIRAPVQCEILSIEPSRFSIEVDRELVTTLPVRVQTVGEPAAGAEAGVPVVRPDRVEVVGPQSLLLNIDTLIATVSVERRAIDFEERVQVRMPHQSIRLTQPTPIVVFVPMILPEDEIALGGGPAAP